MADDTDAEFNPQTESDAPLAQGPADPTSAPEQGSVPESDSVSEPVEGSGAELESGTAPEPGTAPETEAVSEPEWIPEAVEQPDAESEAVSEPEWIPEAVEQPDGESEAVSEPESAAVSESVAAAEPESVPEAVEEPDAPDASTSSATDDLDATVDADASADSGPVTAVSLGLLPETFVSQVSTQLVFYAPEIAPLPARPGPVVESDAPSATARRRSRSRRPEGRDAASEEPEPTPPPRRRAVELITEPQRIKGSTRLEAKKQRRRDGREAGRRRAVVTEAEFLARRESVDRVMIVRSKNGRIQIAVLEDNVLVEHYVARNQDASLIGNVYLGRVQNVLPSMEAAFVDIGRGRNAVLYSGEVDWDAVETGNQPRRIELALKSGDRVLVQVTKDPVGHKGARLTSQISLPGRYLVYVPGGAMNGISRKLPDTERARLKKILKEVLPESSGVIVRTAAEGATEDQLTLDVQRLTSQWEHISRQIETIQAPALLHSEPDLLVKIVRDVFNEDFSKVLIQGEDAHQTITKYVESVAPDLLERVIAYEGENDPFDEFRVTEQIEKALDRKVWLPSGGSLVIDRTEAMTVVDVNTGKFVGSGGNLEETVTKNNLEAAEEIVRQLRLRDIGGIIVVDFIDMVLESNRDLVLRRLVECLSRDRTKHQVAEVTSLGLVQMTRKKLGLGLLETFSEPCEVCAGRGVVVHHDPVVKHRVPLTGSAPAARRPRGGAPSPAGTSNGTHVITEGVKSALAQIAASTIHHHDEAAAVADVPVAAPGERAKKPRKKRSEAAPKPKTEADLLLDSVLSALPEPKAPGQGRSRRRVTTAALTGTPVAHVPSED
ncbi:Rne/Rng family ribonuclease [Microbacterium deminutum]|uniref:S1 motif domain-containing protein n=1 Tax=Microbacterium deminutum TaxID=344164 RepID=A0ABP5CLQ9_9MICO